jgi:hypothetical protein
LQDFEKIRKEDPPDDTYSFTGSLRTIVNAVFGMVLEKLAPNCARAVTVYKICSDPWVRYWLGYGAKAAEDGNVEAFHDNGLFASNLEGHVRVIVGQGDFIGEASFAEAMVQTLDMVRDAFRQKAVQNRAAKKAERERAAQEERSGTTEDSNATDASGAGGEPEASDGTSNGERTEKGEKEEAATEEE